MKDDATPIDPTLLMAFVAELSKATGLAEDEVLRNRTFLFSIVTNPHVWDLSIRAKRFVSTPNGTEHGASLEYSEMILMEDPKFTYADLAAIALKHVDALRAYWAKCTANAIERGELRNQQEFDKMLDAHIERMRQCQIKQHS